MSKPSKSARRTAAYRAGEDSKPCLQVSHGWLVEGAASLDEEALVPWRESHPGFVECTPEWFAQECEEFLVADDADGMCGGGALLLFSCRAAAMKYARRDAATASGLRKVEGVYFVELGRVLGNLQNEWLVQWEQTQQEYTPRMCAAFPERYLYVFRRLEDAEEALVELQAILRT